MIFIYTHILLHFLVPYIIARIFFKEKVGKSYCIMMLSLLVDLDHLLANPIYSPERCSIGFHPLHSEISIAFYLIGCLFTKTRLISIGLLSHMALDLLDCYL